MNVLVERRKFTSWNRYEGTTSKSRSDSSNKAANSRATATFSITYIHYATRKETYRTFQTNRSRDTRRLRSIRRSPVFEVTPSRSGQRLGACSEWCMFGVDASGRNPSDSAAGDLQLVSNLVRSLSLKP